MVEAKKTKKDYLDFSTAQDAFERGNYIGAFQEWHSLKRKMKETGKLNGEFPDSFIDLGIEIHERVFEEKYKHSKMSRRMDYNTLISFDMYIDSMLLKISKSCDPETVDELSNRISKAKKMIYEIRDISGL